MQASLTKFSLSTAPGITASKVKIFFAAELRYMKASMRLHIYSRIHNCTHKGAYSRHYTHSCYLLSVKKIFILFCVLLILLNMPPYYSFFADIGAYKIRLIQLHTTKSDNFDQYIGRTEHKMPPTRPESFTERFSRAYTASPFFTHSRNGFCFTSPGLTVCCGE